MSLLDIARKDLRAIMNSACGARHPVTLLSPEGVEHANIYARYNDIARVQDPDTGLIVSGREVTAALSTEDLRDLGIATPYGVPDESRKPWRLIVTNIHGNLETFKVTSSEPDESLGCVILILEAHKIDR